MSQLHLLLTSSRQVQNIVIHSITLYYIHVIYDFYLGGFDTDFSFRFQIFASISADPQGIRVMSVLHMLNAARLIYVYIHYTEITDVLYNL